MIKYKNKPKELWEFEFWIDKNKLTLEIHNDKNEYLNFNSKEEFNNWLNSLKDFSFDNEKEKQEFIIHCKIAETKAFKEELNKVNFYYKNKLYNNINVYIDKSDGSVIIKFGEITLKLNYNEFENLTNKLKNLILNRKLSLVNDFSFNNLQDLEDFYYTLIIEFKKKKVV